MYLYSNNEEADKQSQRLRKERDSHTAYHT